jgi:hypothetical protein
MYIKQGLLGRALHVEEVIGTPTCFLARTVMIRDAWKLRDMGHINLVRCIFLLSILVLIAQITPLSGDGVTLISTTCSSAQNGCSTALQMTSVMSSWYGTFSKNYVIQAGNGC